VEVDELPLGIPRDAKDRGETVADEPPQSNSNVTPIWRRVSGSQGLASTTPKLDRYFLLFQQLP